MPRSLLRFRSQSQPARLLLPMQSQSPSQQRTSSLRSAPRSSLPSRLRSLPMSHPRYLPQRPLRSSPRSRCCSLLPYRSQTLSPPRSPRGTGCSGSCAVPPHRLIPRYLHLRTSAAPSLTGSDAGSDNAPRPPESLPSGSALLPRSHP